jgi:hypothetical protein
MYQLPAGTSTPFFTWFPVKRKRGGGTPCTGPIAEPNPESLGACPTLL